VHKGSCLCGAVKFEVSGELPAPTACHCSQCRRQSGHYQAGTEVPRSSVKIHGEDKVKWYYSSQKARRGFCSVCGSFLFWDPLHRDWTGISMGAFDKPTGVKLAKHIYVADKGDYYELNDGVPQELHPPKPQ
jgi:hypothetical protein